MKTDTQLQLDVIAELKWQPSVNAAQIGVEVKDGVVTLAGHVDSYAEKWDAERATQRVPGVKALAIELEVKLPGSSRRDDADIARSAGNVLEWMTTLPKDHVKVKVEGGWITLSGEVDWDYQRQSATTGVRHLMGVTGVSDQITLKVTPTRTTLKADIESALHRRTAADIRAITVDVHGADVTLSGTVHSWFERDVASDSAWGTPGVHKVVNNIAVAY